MPPHRPCLFLFFFNDTATTEIYTLSLHDALPIWRQALAGSGRHRSLQRGSGSLAVPARRRSEEHTSELQSQSNLVCRLLLEKKKKQRTTPTESNKPHKTYAVRPSRSTGAWRASSA